MQRRLYDLDPAVDPGYALYGVVNKLPDEMNENICRDFTAEEIIDALSHIGLLKAPGPDGLPGLGSFIKEVLKYCKLMLFMQLRNSLQLVWCPQMLMTHQLF